MGYPSALNIRPTDTETAHRSPYRGIVLDLLLPQRCQICLLPGGHVCDGCGSSLRRIEPPLCERCGAPLVIKWGKHGSFFACSTYDKTDPNSCTFTKENPIDLLDGVEEPAQRFGSYQNLIRLKQ